jgi:Carboxypeptidase regulatory-like domain
MRRSHLPLVALGLLGLLAAAGTGWLAQPVGGAPGAVVLAAGVPAAAPAPLSVAPTLVAEVARPEEPLVQEDPPPDTWTLTGHVSDDLGRPLPGATVSVGARRCTADADGRFALPGLPTLDEQDKLSVVARADWYTSGRLPVSGPVGRDGSSPLAFALARGASLRGQVLRADGTAVAGARIVARTSGRAPEARVPLAADEQCTGWDGRFLFECVEAGEWTVTAEAVGLIGLRVELDVLPGDAATCVSLVLDEAATIDGRVLDRSGMPVAGAELRFEWVDPAAAIGYLSAEELRAAVATVAPAADERPPQRIVNAPYPRTSGADGRFRGSDLAPGEWRVAAIPPPGLLGPMPAVARLHLAPGEAAAVDICLAEPRRLHGVLVDEQGVPAAGLEVTATEKAPLDWRRVPPSARTDALGRFMVEVAPDAEVWLTASWQVRRLSVEQLVQPGDEEPVRLQLNALLDFYKAACSLGMPASGPPRSP